MAKVAVKGRYDRLLMRAVHGELNSWGHWIEAHAYYEGWPDSSILEIPIGAGGQIHGHRVLMLDMPVDVWATHHRVLRLSSILQETVIAWYVVRMKDDGTLWSFEEKCRVLRVTCQQFRVRIHRSKLRISGIVGDIDAYATNQVVSVAI